MRMRAKRRKPILLPLILASGVLVFQLTPASSASAPAPRSLSPTASCSGVTVVPTDDIQAMLDARPTGTTFCFHAGTYVLNSFIVPKSRDRLIGLPGAVLTGQDTYAGGIKGYGGSTGQHDVTVRGFIIEHFLNDWTSGFLAPVTPGWNWTIENNEVRYNSQAGIGASNGTLIRGNNIHHNGRIGISGGPVSGLRVKGNEIAFNNTGSYTGGHEGGVKIIGSSAGSSNLVFRRNRVHDNTGMGLWMDTNVRNVTFELNTVENNSGVGIFHETSWHAVIRNNVIRNNAADYAGKSCWWGAQIHVNDSQKVEVFGNTVVSSNGSNGICAVDIDRTVLAAASNKVANLYVHDNVIRMRLSSTVGLVGRAKAYRASANNRFANNTYFVTDTSNKYWTWRISTVRWSRWRHYGNDKTGSLLVW